MSLSAKYLMDLGMSFAPARTILSALELNLFTVLHDKSLTADEIREELSLHPRFVRDFLDCLYALKVITREGKGTSAEYSNSKESQAFLSRSSDSYIGDFLALCANQVYELWCRLTDGLLTGKMQVGAKDFYSQTFSKGERLDFFLKSMISFSGPSHKVFAETFSFKDYNSLLDLGGGVGRLCCYIAENHPHLKCTTFDLPLVEKAARKFVTSQGMQNVVEVKSGDIFTDDIGKPDIIIMSLLLHSFSLEQKKATIQKCYDALPEGGVAIAIEWLIDDKREKHIEGMMMSLNMLLCLGYAFDFTGSDYWSWAKEVGFKSYRVMKLEYPMFAAIVTK